MILTRAKQTKPKTLTDGIWQVKIESISESMVDGKSVVIFKFRHVSGRIASLTMPVDKKLHSIICNLMQYTNVEKYSGLDQFIGRQITIEIVKNNIKYITK